MENIELIQLAQSLERSGCATRLQNPRTLEIYGVNLAEHFVLTLKQQTDSVCDLLFVPPIQSYTRSTQMV